MIKIGKVNDKTLIYYDIIKKNNIFEIVKDKIDLIKTLEIKLSDFGASK